MLNVPAIGSKVTAEPPGYFDGVAVHNWPDPDYVATVTAVEVIYGVTYVTAKRDRMARPYRAPLAELYLLPPL